MHTVSLFGHFETWDRVAFKREGCSKYIQNNSNLAKYQIVKLDSTCLIKLLHFTCLTHKGFFKYVL